MGPAGVGMRVFMPIRKKGTFSCRKLFWIAAENMPELRRLVVKQDRGKWHVRVWISTQRHPNGKRTPVCANKPDALSAWQAMPRWLDRHSAKLPEVSKSRSHRHPVARISSHTG